MANVFPDQSSGRGFGSHVAVFADAACTVPATVSNPTTGAVMPKGLVPIVNGTISPFTSSASVLYARNDAGGVVTLYPHIARTMATITGAKAGNAALTSLISALAGEGLPVDSPT